MRIKYDQNTKCFVTEDGEIITRETFEKISGMNFQNLSKPKFIPTAQTSLVAGTSSLKYRIATSLEQIAENLTPPKVIEAKLEPQKEEPLIKGGYEIKP